MTAVPRLSFELRLGVLVSLLVLGGNVLAVSSRLGFLHKPKQVKELDHWHYLEMAKGPEGKPELTHQSTYCWRVFVPFLARLLSRAGLSPNLAFFLITNISLLGFLLALWAYLGALGLPLADRVAGLALVGLTQGAVRWYEYQYWMTDPTSLFLLVLAFLLIRQGRTAALYPVSALAAFVREHNAVVFPYYFLNAQKGGVPLARAALGTAAIAALPVAILVGLRMIIVPSQPADLLADLADTMGFRWRHRVDQPYQLTVGSLGVIFPLLVLFPARIPALARRHYDQLAVVAFFYGLLAIANNTEREIAYALPVLLPAAMRQLGDFAREARLPAPPLLVLAVALQLLFFFEQRFLESGSSMYQPTNWTVVGAMGLFWLAAQAALLWRRAPAG